MNTEQLIDRLTGSPDDREVAAVDELVKDAARTELHNGKLIVQDTGPMAHLFDTARFEHCYRIASALAKMSLLPDHLRYAGPAGNKTLLEEQTVTANCFRIVSQAILWEMDPFAIVDETYCVAGRLGFTGKLIAAIVNTRAGLHGRLTYEHAGKGDDRTVTVRGQFSDTGKTEEITLRFGDAATKQGGQVTSQWTNDPDQKLCYSGAIKWARRHCPEVIQGIKSDDEVAQMAIDEETAGAPVQVPDETRPAPKSKDKKQVAKAAAPTKAKLPTKAKITTALKSCTSLESLSNTAAGFSKQFTMDDKDMLNHIDAMMNEIAEDKFGGE